MRNRRLIDDVRSIVIVASLVGSFSFGTASTAADNVYVWTVQKLNDSKPWDRFLGSPTPIRVEGRIQTQGNGQIKLQRCDATFTIEKSKLQSLKSKSYVELRGFFKKDGTKIVFAVEDVRETPSYTEEFDRRKGKLRLPTPDDWIELGDWAMERANIYDDPDLSKRANEAYTNAIEAEYQTLKRAELAQNRMDAEGRFELAKKFETYKLSDRRRMELIHEAFRIQWQALQKTDASDTAEWQKFADRLSKELKGAADPLHGDLSQLKQSYAQDPDGAYRRADDLVRVQLHRIFIISVLRKILLFDESADGRDGDRIADRIEELIPEESELAEAERRKRMEFGLKNIAKATRGEAEKLAAAYRQRGLDETGKRVLVEWIKSHEAERRKDGLQGLLLLADEYAFLLGDRQAATESLLEASKIDPMFEGVKSKLTALGYQFRNGRWVKIEGEVASAPVVETPTQITAGMTATNLRLLLGQPRSLTRAITSNSVTEIWLFGPAGSSQLIVRLEQKGGDKEPRVTRFSGQ